MAKKNFQIWNNRWFNFKSLDGPPDSNILFLSFIHDVIIHLLNHFYFFSFVLLSDAKANSNKKYREAFNKEYIWLICLYLYNMFAIYSVIGFYWFIS